MRESTPTVEDSTDGRLLGKPYQITNTSLVEGAAVCQVSGTELPDGTPVAVYGHRPVSPMSATTVQIAPDPPTHGDELVKRATTRDSEPEYRSNTNSDSHSQSQSTHDVPSTDDVPTGTPTAAGPHTGAYSVAGGTR